MKSISFKFMFLSSQKIRIFLTYFSRINISQLNVKEIHIMFGILSFRNLKLQVQCSETACQSTYQSRSITEQCAIFCRCKVTSIVSYKTFLLPTCQLAPYYQKEI